MSKQTKGKKYLSLLLSALMAFLSASPVYAADLLPGFDARPFIEVTDVQKETAEVLSDQIEKLDSMESGKDYDASRACCMTDSKEEAENIADQYGAELVRYSNGVAVLSFSEGNGDISSALGKIVESVETVTKAESVISTSGVENAALGTLAAEDPQLAEEVSKIDVSALPDTPVYPEIRHHIFTVDPSDDKFYEEQWHLTSINAEEAWDKGADGSGVKVAVVDSGSDERNSDLSTTQLYTGSYSSGHDDNGHGTHCSGLVAGLDNSVGGLGVAPKATLISIKVLDYEGSGYTSDIVEGLEIAMKNNVDVISMSYGSEDSDSAEQEAIKKAIDKGIVCVAAAGNECTNTKSYPACYDGVISVGAYNAGYQLTDFSNYGNWVSLAAPGESILSTVVEEGYLDCSGDDRRSDGGIYYGRMDGTSAACPIVAGAAAAVLSKYNDLTVSQLTKCLTSSASDQTFSYGGHSVKNGIDISAALDIAANVTDPEVTDPPKQTMTTVTKLQLTADSRVSKWKSSDTGIATVAKKNNQACLVKGKKAGTVTITGLYKGETVIEYIVTVEKPTLTKQALNQKATLDIHDWLSGVEESTPTRFVSSNNKVLKVDAESGEVQVLKNGAATISVYFGKGRVAKKYNVKFSTISGSVTVKNGGIKRIAIKNYNEAIEDYNVRSENEELVGAHIEDNGYITLERYEEGKVTVYLYIGDEQYGKITVR